MQSVKSLATNWEVGRPVLGPWCWVEPCQVAEAQLCPPCQAVSGAVSVSSPPVLSGFCRFSLPGSGNTHPSKRMGRNKSQTRRFKKRVMNVYPWLRFWLKFSVLIVTRDRLNLKKIKETGCTGVLLKTEVVYCISYPAVSGLIHVTLNLACICHQVLHSPVLQCCGVWGGEYGLYTVERAEKCKTQWRPGSILFKYDLEH